MLLQTTVFVNYVATYYIEYIMHTDQNGNVSIIMICIFFAIAAICGFILIEYQKEITNFSSTPQPTIMATHKKSDTTKQFESDSFILTFSYPSYLEISSKDTEMPIKFTKNNRVALTVDLVSLEYQGQPLEEFTKGNLTRKSQKLLSEETTKVLDTYALKIRIKNSDDTETIQVIWIEYGLAYVGNQPEMVNIIELEDTDLMSIEELERIIDSLTYR